MDPRRGNPVPGLPRREPCVVLINIMIFNLHREFYFPSVEVNDDKSRSFLGVNLA